MTEKGYKTFEDIKAWQLATEFRRQVYGITKRFPEYEKFVLTPQIRRAAISISANIAEGFGRYSFQENIQFCRIARGSLNEVLDQFHVALDEKYIDEKEFEDLSNNGREVEKAINGYIGFLKDQKSNF
jgi:four helix bundle protein